MELNGSQTQNFETIEKAVQDGSFEALSPKTLKEIRQILLTNSPLSDNPKFVQRWERVFSAVTSKIESKTTARRFKVQIALGLATLFLVLLNIYLAHAFPSNTSMHLPPHQGPQPTAESGG